MVIKTERKKLNKQEVQKAIITFSQKLNKEKIPVQKLVLFGSYARGQAHIDSDIDVAVIISPNIAPNIRKKIQEIAWWAKQINVKLEPHVLSAGDWQNRWLSLPAEIKKSANVFA